MRFDCKQKAPPRDSTTRAVAVTARPMGVDGPALAARL